MGYVITPSASSRPILIFSNALFSHFSHTYLVTILTLALVSNIAKVLLSQVDVALARENSVNGPAKVGFFAQ